MNKKYVLKIPVKGVKVPESKGLDAPQEKGKVEVIANLDLTINTMLKPMYATEAELLAMFVDEEEYGKYYLKAREIAFTASLKADEYLKSRFKLSRLPEEHILLFKRELTQCLSVNALANFFFKAYPEQMSRSKTLGEFSVSTSVKNNTSALRDIISSSKDCIKEAKAAIEQMEQLSGAGLGLSFNKGSHNIGNKFSYRTWWHNNLPERSNQIYASDKYRHYNGNWYKDGSNGRGLGYVSKSGTYYPRRTT